jgi:putative hydrolases of HD superfamily
MKPGGQLLDLLLEVESLDRVARTGYVLRGVAQPESVTEHSWHVQFLVWVLGSHDPSLNLERAVAMAMIHDLAELRVGDLPLTARHYFPPGSKRIAESQAMADLLSALPPAARELYAEYAEGATAEARLVKACDKLQLMLKVSVYESWGTGALAEFWDNPDNFPELGIPAVAELFAALRARHGADRGKPKPQG